MHAPPHAAKQAWHCQHTMMKSVTTIMLKISVLVGFWWHYLFISLILPAFYDITIAIPPYWKKKKDAKKSDKLLYVFNS